MCLLLFQLSIFFQNNSSYIPHLVRILVKKTLLNSHEGKEKSLLAVILKITYLLSILFLPLLERKNLQLYSLFQIITISSNIQEVFHCPDLLPTGF